MVDTQEIRNIHMLQDLSEEKLQKISELANLQIVNAETILYREGENLNNLYMLLSGKIILEVDASEDISVTLGVIKPRFTIGTSSLISKAKSYATAFCVEPSEVITIDAAKLYSMLESDLELGFLFMQRIVHIYESRLAHRTSQFLQALRNHPELQRLFQKQ
ncbi:MAG: Crp/Fnr family transcriptional regulator [Thermodesulfobacteriota bacterium]